jgi:DNA invertase Pin-like site-specific DNA recombinase
MRIGIYARVSTHSQDTENQVVQLREFASRQGWQIIHEYCDVESGGKAERPEFKRMFVDASKRRFDLVLFWALDRLSREGVLETLTYLNRLESYGVGFRSFTEPYFDSCGLFKDAVIAILAVLAKQERIRRSERTKAGLARAISRGKILGRPKTITTTPAQVKKLRSSGYSFRAAARKLGISLRSVQRLAVS